MRFHAINVDRRDGVLLCQKYTAGSSIRKNGAPRGNCRVFFLLYLLDSERGILISGLRRNPLPDLVRGAAAEEVPVQEKRGRDKTRPSTDPI